ncbi:MAG: DUF47 family protein [Acidobacteriota bacterium]
MKFISRDSEFFDLFDRQVGDLIRITEILSSFVKDFKVSEEMRTRFKEAEHEADITTHEIIDKVNRTFITPIDREDIHSLAQAMDDIVDLIDASAGRVFLYEITQPTEEMKRFVEIIHKMVQEISKAIGMLRNLKNQRRLLDHCIEINRLENEADATLLTSIEKLVENRKDFFEFLRWKEVYESLESATDKCEDVANIIEGIVIKSI